MGSSSLTLYPLLFVFNVYVATKINIKSQGCRKDNHEFRRLSKAHYVSTAVNRLTEQ